MSELTAVTGIVGATVVANGTTGYTLTIPGLTPSTSYTAAVDAGDTVWRYEATTTSNTSGVGTFVFTFAALPTPGATIYVTATSLSSATNFPATAVTFGATTDTAPVAITGLAGATLAGDGASGYVMAVPGLTPNVVYTVSDADGMSSFYGATATSDGAGLVTFSIPSAQWGAEAGATLNLVSSSAASGTNADGTFVVPDAAPVVVVTPDDDERAALYRATYLARVRGRIGVIRHLIGQPSASRDLRVAYAPIIAAIAERDLRDYDDEELGL